MQDQDVQLGEFYTDEVTSFAGIATAVSVFIGDEPSLICLENESDHRWLPTTRVYPESETAPSRASNKQTQRQGAGGGRSGSQAHSLKGGKTVSIGR